MAKYLNYHIFPNLSSKSKFTKSAIVPLSWKWCWKRVRIAVKQKLINCCGTVFWFIQLKWQNIWIIAFFTIFIQKIKIFLLCNCSTILKMLLEARKWKQKLVNCRRKVFLFKLAISNGPIICITNVTLKNFTFVSLIAK